MMYSYIKGTIKIIDPKGITIDNHDIGYFCVVPNPYAFNLNEEAHIHTFYYVREDQAVLFGFKTLEERSLFERLIKVKGIGPKSALAVLASGDVESTIRAIESGDAKYLNRFPGIGPKASQQIVLDLKGKMASEGITLKGSSKLDEVEDALISLGYKSKEIQKLIKDLDPNLETAVLVRQALRKISN